MENENKDFLNENSIPDSEAINNPAEPEVANTSLESSAGNEYKPKEEIIDSDNSVIPEDKGLPFTQNTPENRSNPETPVFYTENYRKVKKNRNYGLVHLIVIALISSIIGGSVVGGIFLANKSGDDTYSSSLSQDTAVGSSKNDYTKVVIDSSGSPVSAIAQKVNKSIVGIKVSYKSDNLFLGSQSDTGEGTGIIIKSGGYIMTNNHVIEGAINPSTGQQSSDSKIEVVLPSQTNKSYVAKIVGRDTKSDLAVLKIDVTGLPVAEFGNSDNLKIGELAVAIGNPGGLDYMGSVTVGVISGLNRTISPEDSDLKLIQTDAAINPGNSGGALLNSKGQVIGINSAKIVAQGFEGLGFAIPINTAKSVVDQLLTTGYVKGKPSLGIVCSSSQDYNADIAKANNLPVGVLIDSVTPLSGAYKAGLQRGDIITKFDGAAIKDFDSLNAAKSKHKAGDTVTVEYFRDGKTIKANVTLQEQKY